MIELIRSLNQNKFFKFISSIRMAVPVMLTLITAVATGTVFESLYSADYAKIAVYDTMWFNILLGFLAVNIFASMLSRYPWKLRHLGFVITHCGILILLTGSFLTRSVGIDGSLQIQEGGTGNTIILPDLMIAYQYDNSPSLISASFKKSLFEQDASDMSAVNAAIGHVVKIERFLPFAELEKSYVTDEAAGAQAVGIGFQMKSRFFDVKEWLHSVDQPQMQMGPATLKIIVDKPGATSAVKSAKSAVGESLAKTEKAESRIPAAQEHQAIGAARPLGANQKTQLVVKEAASGKTLQTWGLVELKKGVEFSGVKIQAVKVFNHATVSENKITEGRDPNAPLNPALEFQVVKGSESKREVLYAKFPQFSLNKEGVFGYRFEFQAGQASEPNPHQQMQAKMDSEEGSAPPMMGGGGPNGNTIEFHVDPADTKQVRVELWKAGKKIAERKMKEGEVYQTPWMGMQLYLASITVGAQASYDVRAVKPKAGMKVLPGAAVLVRPAGSDKSIWLSQGDVKSVEIAGRPASLVFSNQTLTLPFTLRLKKFTKTDYPGTETPFSYESLVRDEESGQETLISMNEPLKLKDYTLYQASFSMNPGEPAVSILSVNQDPGRWIKYLGSIVLSMGIIIFTLMRSRFYRGQKVGG